MIAPPASARPVRFSTLALAQADRRPRWEAWNRAALIGLDTATAHGHGPLADQAVLALPGVSVARVRAEGHRVRRSAQAVASSPSAALVVYVMLTGTTTFAGRGRFGPGAAAVLDADRPFERWFAQGFTELVVKVPRSSAGGVGAVRAVEGVDAVRVRALARQLSRAQVDESASRTLALDLVSGLLAPGRTGDRLALARVLIDQHLHEGSLSAGRLAAALGVSERQLSRLFAGAGTSVPAEITGRRLARASSLLVADLDRPVAEVARACGFSSTSYFDRVFRDRFGLTPRQHRAA